MVGEWSESSLGDLVEIEHGFAFKGDYFRDEPPGDILLTPGNFAIGGGFKSDKLKYYDGPVPDEFVLHQGDLIVTMTDLSKESDTLGYSAFVPTPSKGRRYLHNQRLGKVVVKDKAAIALCYVHYLMCSSAYRHEVLASATGTTVKHTSPERIKRFRFLRPSLPEQRAIAHILGTLDDKIEPNHKMNDTLEAMAQALFKNWFVEFEPFRNQGMEDSPLGPIPKGWRVGTLGQICDIIMGQSPPGDTYNESGEGTPFYQGIRDFGPRFPALRVYCTAPTRFAQKGDILLSVRAPVGSLNIATEYCSIGRGVAALRLKSEHGGFLYYLLKANHLKWEKFEAEGTVFGAANKADVHGLEIIVPSNDIIKRFSNTIEPLDTKIELNERESQTLASIRDTLLPKLLSGELRVKYAERFAGDVT